MTLGTNASIQEQLEYAPHELSIDLVFDELAELEAWRELFIEYEDAPQDVKERIEYLKDRIADLENEVETLKWNLEQALEPRPNQA